MGGNLKISGRRVGRRGRRALASDINVTPFVDVMLVLLVIFMLTAPMLISGIDVDLPHTKTSPISGHDEPLVLSIDKDGNYYVQDIKTSYQKLIGKIAAILAEKRDIRVFIKGDRRVDYGRVAQLFGLVKELGVKNIALVTAVDDTKYIDKDVTSTSDAQPGIIPSDKLSNKLKARDVSDIKS